MKFKQNLFAHRGGFTLIEMMIVIGIIAILAALTLGISNSVLRNSEISRTRDVLKLLDMALQEWELEMGRSMTFRDFSCPEGVGGGFGQGNMVFYSYDVNSFFDIDGNPLEEPLLAEPVFGGVPVDDEIMLEAMETRIEALIHVLRESEPATEILQRISPDYFIIDDHPGAHNICVDSWDTPIGIVFPCQNYTDADLNGSALPQDESGDLSVRDQAEDGLGSCLARRPYFVSAGPDGLWGYRYQASSPIPDQAENEEWLASLDNIYSYEPYLVEESR